tara:strand:- start:508 stop:711 length:204 start_codon:yes stop_codon:yes gene_type:complete
MGKILDEINDYMRSEGIKENDLYKSEDELLGSILNIIEKETLKKNKSNIIQFPTQTSGKLVESKDYE